MLLHVIVMYQQQNGQKRGQEINLKRHHRILYPQKAKQKHAGVVGEYNMKIV